MVESPKTFVMTNLTGEALDLRKYLLSSYYFISHDTLIELAEFSCIKEKRNQPWFLETKVGRYEFSSTDCVPKKQ